MSNWEAQALQFAWFTPSAGELKADALFLTGFGEEADQIQRSRHPSPATPYLSLATAHANGISRKVLINPGRIDLILAAQDDSGVQGISTLPDTTAQFAALFDCAQRISSEIANTIRVAVVATLAQPVEDARAAAELIASRIGGIGGDLGNVTDLFFQVNRFRPFNCDPSLRMNRVVRFASVQLQLMTLMVSPLQGAANQAPFDLGFAGQIVIDLNSAPAPTPFRPEQQLAILEELYAESLRIRSIGTVAALDA